MGSAAAHATTVPAPAIPAPAVSPVCAVGCELLFGTYCGLIADENIRAVVVDFAQSFRRKLCIHCILYLFVGQIVELSAILQLDPLVCLKPGEIGVFIEVVTDILRNGSCRKQ